MAFMKIALSAAMCAALSGCEAVEQHESSGDVEITSAAKPQEVAPKRISVQKIGGFTDPIAYGGVRGVYVINDSKTGIEYIGISGIGIAEAAGHWTGKFQTHEER